jgi:hypothetical protein
MKAIFIESCGQCPNCEVNHNNNVCSLTNDFINLLEDIPSNCPLINIHPDIVDTVKKRQGVK